MYLLIKNSRVYKAPDEPTDNIEIVNAFGRRWEVLTHSEEDKYLASIWDREYRYKKLKNEAFKDGLYRLVTKGKFKIVFPL